MDTFSLIPFHTQLTDTPEEVRQKAVLAAGGQMAASEIAANGPADNYRK